MLSVCTILDLQDDGNKAKESISILQRGLLINLYIFFKCHYPRSTEIYELDKWSQQQFSGFLSSLAYFVSCWFYVLDSCTDIKSIGKPITHNTRWLSYGAWMKDPLGIMGTETIFTMEHFHSDAVQEFENMAKFKAGLPRKTYKLPYLWDGTGAVVYGPYLFFNR